MSKTIDAVKHAGQPKNKFKEQKQKLTPEEEKAMQMMESHLKRKK